MISLLRAFFGPLPVAGERYILADEAKNPFERHKYVVTVKEVREGWVLYAYPSGGTSSMTASSFRFCYAQEALELLELEP